jgi:4-hydroxy-4-methyl-2-oxoglutarate aldolase
MSDSVQELVTRLAKLDVSDVADQFDRFGLVPPVLARELRPIGTAQKFCGTAFCISGHKLNASGWLAMPTDRRDPLYDALDERVPQGSVLLYATSGYDDAAVFGGDTALALKQRGVEGVIVDGAVRDVAEISRYGLPVLARAVSAIRFVGRFAVTAIDAAIEMRGLTGAVQAVTGDLVLCDDDGAIVVPGGLAQHLIEATEVAAAVSLQMRNEVMQGSTRFEAARKFRPE